MVYERVTGAVPDASVHAQPDKRWLGVLLCAVSAVLTLTLAGLIAGSVLSKRDVAINAQDFPAFERFQPAAGRDHLD